MILYKKYLFENEEQYLKKINGLPENLQYTEILLPNASNPKDTLGDEPEIETDDDLTSVAVDMLWENITESPYGWKTYEINPTNPWNRVLGIDQD